ncbi:hypothetical protein P8C59_009485 [Phyllachora maydis]|uniref:Uncharacterized protein n=1 Tax=Phyllachora maydis TaxID=1825666 RepID=A0AAD9IDV2_9PEZI|nr:hypothetical protein P8C59_009485 [Phyllachora maydis]
MRPPRLIRLRLRLRLRLQHLLRQPPHPGPRHFTQNTVVRTTTTTTMTTTRPQLPFLSAPSAARPHQFRYLTTERRAWLHAEVRRGVKYTLYLWLALASAGGVTWVLYQEVLERAHPTPREWSFFTRFHLRTALAEAEVASDPNHLPDWVLAVQLLGAVVERLEDPAIDGQGVRDGPGDSDRPDGAKDVSDMPETWRRGYFEALLAWAWAAEHVDGWVRDRTRNLAFRPEVVIGPSNPHPKPIPYGAQSPPREQDCDPIFPSPNQIYLKMLYTEGLSVRQRMHASLAYANWLEYKGLAGPADAAYEEAVRLAASETTAAGPGLLDDETLTLNDAAGPPSANLLTALTALATSRARHGDVDAALPTLVSLLRARRSLPATATPLAPPTSRASDRPDPPPADALSRLRQRFLRLVREPPYPPPPPPGTAPPARDAKALCDEAALQLHIGEILYATAAPARRRARDEGLAWTREAVDAAEEQLHRLGRAPAAAPPEVAAAHRAARTACRECLAAGLGNWAAMVARLARQEEEEEEEEAQGRDGEAAGAAAWFGLWRGRAVGPGAGPQRDRSSGRWAAEEKVVLERQRRAGELLDGLEPPPRGFGALAQSMFQA